MCALQKEILKRIRADFPALAQQFWGKLLVYLDNAATSQKPKSVLELLNRMNSLTNANVHRAMYTLSDRPDFITFLRHHIAHNDNQRVT